MTRSNALPSIISPPLAGSADRALRELARSTDAPPLHDLDGAQLLMERAYLNGFCFRTGRSPGGSCRLLAARDGTIAVNLPRPSDWELIPAWLEGDARPWSWARLAAALAKKETGQLVDRARLLGIAASASRTAPCRPEGWYEIDGAAMQPRAGANARRGAPRVIDLSGLWAGPLCGHLLHLAGADVIKVESTRRPDGARSGNAAFYGLLNQGKRSVALDLGVPEGRCILLELLLGADIVIESSRPRALKQMGIDASSVLERRPGLTWVSITGYGRDDPEGNWVAFGDDAGVAAGLSEVMRAAVGAYEFAGDAIADPLTGIRAALAAWQSWLEGRGRLISLALTQVAAWSLAQERSRLGDDGLRGAFAAWWKAARAGQAVSGLRPRPILEHVSSLGEDTHDVLGEIRC